MQDALEQALSEGGKVFGGERQLEDKFPNAYYVSPAIVEMPEQSDVVCTKPSRRSCTWSATAISTKPCA
jgi:aldehyde dehydrogenase (NAD+)